MASPSYAGPLVKSFELDDFTGGLNYRVDAFTIRPNELTLLNNMDIDPRGGIATRGGWKQWATSALGTAISGAGKAWNPRKLHVSQFSVPTLLVSSWDNSTSAYNVYKSTDGAVWTYLGANADGKTTFGGCFANWKALTYFARGVGATAQSKYDGTTVTTLTVSATGAWQTATTTGTHMPLADFCCAHAGFMWVASTKEDGTAFPYRIRWSNLNDPESWQQNNYKDIPSEGGAITALVEFQDHLLIFKQNAVYAVYGYDDQSFSLVKIADTVGTVSQASLTVTPNAVYFFSWPDGVFKWDGKAVFDVFKKIRPMLQNGGVDPSNLTYVFMGNLNERIWLALPEGLAASSTRPSYNYVLDPTLSDTGSWTRFFTDNSTHATTETAAVGPCVEFINSAGTRKWLGAVWSGVASTARVLELETTDPHDQHATADSSTIQSDFTTPWITQGSKTQKHNWKRPDFVLKQQNVQTKYTINVFHDFIEEKVARTIEITQAAAVAGMVWDSDPWDTKPWGTTPAGAEIKRASNLGLARSIQIHVESQGDLPWGVDMIAVKHVPRRIRG